MIKINPFLIITLFIFCALASLGQEITDIEKKANADLQKTLQIYTIVSNLKSELRNTPIAGVRVFVKYKTAAWIWKTDKGSSQEGESLAIEAFEELYERKGEIPDLYFNKFNSELLALLQLHAPESAAKLSKKYVVNSGDGIAAAYDLLKNKDGAKLAVENLQKGLSQQSDLNPLTIFFLGDLQSKKSPQLSNVLTQMLNLEETGTTNYSTKSMFLLIHFFRDPAVSNVLRIKFFNLILDKCRNSLNSPDANLADEFNLVSAVLQDIATTAPSLLTEANRIKNTLMARVPQSESQSREIYDKINNSLDPLSEMISQAELTDNKALKQELLGDAAHLALKKDKFRLAVDLAEKKVKDKDSLAGWYDQFLGKVAQQSLKKDDADSSKYATAKIINELTRADVLNDTAMYFHAKRDLASATDSLNESLKLVDGYETGVAKTNSLLRLVSIFQTVDKNQVSNVIEKTAKAINLVPSLGIDDKPETENYRKYVTGIMQVNWNLLSAMEKLAKENKNEAINLSERITKKEIKVVANYSLVINSLYLPQVLDNGKPKT